MRLQSFSLIFISVMLAVSLQLQANPFACKIKKPKIRKPSKPQAVIAKQPKIQQPAKPQTALTYMGYAIMENQQFAIVQLKKNQFILKRGESAQGIKIIRFTADSLIYQQHDTIFSIPINPHNP